MTSIFIAADAVVNIVISVCAIHQTLKNQHSLNAFASKSRWTVVFLGATEFFLALRFLGTGLDGTYVAFAGGTDRRILFVLP